MRRFTPRLPLQHLAAIALALPLAMITGPLAGQERENPQFSPAQLEFFENQVRPLLAKRCYSCHSATAAKIKGGLRLDGRSLVLKGGDTGPAAVPGKPAESLLVDAINYGEVYQMPPKNKLAAREIAILTRWVSEGLAWPAGENSADARPADDFDLQKRAAEHWCWQPVKRQRLPRVQDRAWPLQPLDNFILHQLDKNGLSPAAPADRRSLIRRAYFDLLGLPPTPAAVEAFAGSEDPSAFAAVVDQLLESPHFGERWARHWMDLVRYAETHGHEFDYPIHNAYQYRDYLIRALNQDVPYDAFITEHIAGDLLHQPRRNPENGINESVIATGFWYMGEATHAPVDVLGDQATRVDNQLDVMAKTFLGITLACARCHDHKFDAISSRDYYSMFGYMQSSRRNTALLDPHGRIAEAVTTLTAERALATAAVEKVLVGDDRQPAAVVQKYLAAARDVGFGSRREHPVVARENGLDETALRSWCDLLLSEATLQPDHPFHLWRLAAEKPATEVEAVVTAFLAGQQRLADASSSIATSHPQIPLVDDKGITWLPHGQAFPPGQDPLLVLGNGPAHFLPVGQLSSGSIAAQLEGSVRSPLFTLTHKNIHLRLKGDGVTVRLILEGYYMDEFNALLFRGFKQEIKGVNQLSWRTLGGDVGRYLGHRGYLEVIDHGGGSILIDEVRQSDAGPPPAGPNEVAMDVSKGIALASHDDIAAAYARWWKGLPGRWSGEDRSLADTLLANSMLAGPLLAPGTEAVEAIAAAGQRHAVAAGALPAPMKVLAIADGDGQDHPVYIRGNPHTPGEIAPRGFLTAVTDPAAAQPTGSGSGRLVLARHITSPENPLTSRVIVNRCWHHLFGKGLVSSVDNFGVLGDRPSHPRLLDHLAAEFIADGWSIKRLLRRMMLSRSYQMSSQAAPSIGERDPTNRLLHRANVRRLPGEVIRDSLLAISGRLDRDKLYGPPVPIHITPFMTGRGRPGGSGPLDGQGRRSIYISVRRNFLSPMMLAFDTPIPFNSMGRRNVSNVPSQSLIMMNDPLVFHLAQLWGTRIAGLADKSSHERIRLMFLEALSREPTGTELERSMAFLLSQASEYGIAADQLDREQRCWTDLGHVLFNMKSFIFLY